MFKEVLEGIRDRVDGALAISLIGLDGIAVDSINRSDLPLDSMGAEFGSFMKSLRLSNTEIGGGEVQQFSLVTDKYITFLSGVSADYFILLVLDRHGNYGRARFELMKARHTLRDELS